MSEKNLATAVAYYEAMHNKDISTIEKCLHPDVCLISPLAEVRGKEAVLQSVKHFIAFISALSIRAQCASGDQAMLAYDISCPSPIGSVRGAVLLTFQEGLIIGYELFYDPRPFEVKKDEIFAET